MAFVRSAPAGPPSSGRQSSRPSAAPAYRADIDGLRAVAVSGVIAFHYGFGPLRGGFTGVDVFFVISGYLVAAILSGTDASLAALGHFAERRLRRIVPALLVVVAASSLAAPILMLPNDLKSVGLGLMNAVAFNANHYFAVLADDYFAAGSLAADPMLHMWSLAVEAQFYLVFALLWTLGRRWPAARAVAIVLLAAISFVASLFGTAFWPSATFYLLPPRFWEFVAGAALALLRARPPGFPGGEAASVAGLGLIVTGLLAFDGATPFPGAAALVPCCGAALVILGGESPNRASRLLGAQPLAWVGRLSYALYLWHWPVLVFAAYGEPAPLPAGERLALLALTGVLAVATHRFVERPLIERRLLARGRPFLTACAVAMAGVAAGGLVVNLAGQNRIVLVPLPPAVQVLSQGQYDVERLHCPVGGQADPGCRFGDPSEEPTIVLWGNSFARMWMPALAASARRHKAAGTALLLIRCPPLLATTFPATPGCERFNRDALAYIDAHPSLRTVILGGDWSLWAAKLPALRGTVEALQARGRRVVLILSPPQVPYEVPRTLALAALRHRPPPPPVTEEEAQSGRRAETTAVAALAQQDSALALDPMGVFCDGRTCAVQAEGRPFYYDQRHVTRFGASRAEALFDPVFEPRSTP